jgi:inosine-uridine nucleoside N-ribohydrolase
VNSLHFILDTDIGDDGDDALALALTLNSPELELRGAELFMERILAL